MSVGLTPEVTTPPVGAILSPVTVRLLMGRLLPVVDNHILLELDEVDLGVEQSPGTLRFSLVLASGITEMPSMGLRINGTEDYARRSGS